MRFSRGSQGYGEPFRFSRRASGKAGTVQLVKGQSDHVGLASSRCGRSRATHPAWFDLAPEDRSAAFDVTLAQREAEAATDPPA